MKQAYTEIANENNIYFENHKELIDRAVENSYISDIDDTLELKMLGTPNNYDVVNNIEIIDTISCALREVKLKSNNDSDEVIVLNFADGISIGGGYLYGARAQEEAICRCSGLYNVLASEKLSKMYHDNSNTLYGDTVGTNRMIFSKYVPVIRDSSHKYLENIEYISVITSAAVKNTTVKFLGIDVEPYKVMDKRIEKIVKLAISKKPKAIILGAYGCGVFGNDRRIVYKIFEKHINNYLSDESGIKVLFAVI